MRNEGLNLIGLPTQERLSSLRRRVQKDSAREPTTSSASGSCFQHDTIDRCCMETIVLDASSLHPSSILAHTPSFQFNSARVLFPFHSIPFRLLFHPPHTTPHHFFKSCIIVSFVCCMFSIDSFPFLIQHHRHRQHTNKTIPYLSDKV